MVKCLQNVRENRNNPCPAFFTQVCEVMYFTSSMNQQVELEFICYIDLSWQFSLVFRFCEFGKKFSVSVNITLLSLKWDEEQLMIIPTLQKCIRYNNNNTYTEIVKVTGTHQLVLFLLSPTAHVQNLPGEWNKPGMFR